jgi:hypothetical protein
MIGDIVIWNGNQIAQMLRVKKRLISGRLMRKKINKFWFLKKEI